MSVEKPNSPNIEEKIFICEVCDTKVQGYTNLMRHRETLKHKQKLVKYMKDKPVKFTSVKMTDDEILSIQTIDVVCKNICYSLGEFVEQDARIERFGDLSSWESKLHDQYHVRLQNVLRQQFEIKFEKLDLASQSRILLKRRDCIAEIINQLARSL